MPVASIDSLYAQVRRRMIEGGEWDKLQAALNSKLNESGWVDDIKHRTKEQVRDSDNASFESIIEEVTPHAQKSVPLAIKQEMIALIRQYLEKQFE